MTPSPSFIPTLIRWYNSAPDERGQCSKVASADVGSYESIPYGSVKTGEVHANGKPPHPVHGQWQTGLSCSRTSRTVVVDVDDDEAYRLSDLETVLPLDQATSYRITGTGLKMHFVVIVPEELVHLYPKQGATLWGDIKANGFSYVTGVHYSGSEYQSTGVPFIVADQELLEAISAEPRAQAQGVPGVSGTGDWSDPGYHYKEGTKWNLGRNDVASMVNQGWIDADINQLMTEILVRSEGYTGRGEEVAGWIESARRKYNLAEGESYAAKKVREEDDFMAGMFGREKWEARKVAAMAQAERVYKDKQAERAYAQNPQEWVTQAQQTEELHSWQVPDLSVLDLADLVNPAGYRIEPAGTTDSHLADLVLKSSSPGMVQYALDSGCWLINRGRVWEEWGTKTEAREYAKSLVVAWARNLKSVDEAEEEDKERAPAWYDEKIAEYKAKKAAGTLTDDEKSDPPSPVVPEHTDGWDERKKRLQANHKRLRSNEGTSAVASLIMAQVRIRPEYCTRIADLDSRASVLWAGGAPWSLLHPELTLLPQEAGQVHIKNCPTAPVPGPTPLWDEAMTALFPDPELRAWAFREIAGAALWGATSKQHPVLDGKPNAGKSTVTDTIRKILGTYGVDVDPNKLIGGSDNSSTEEEKAVMIGARMVLLDEPPKRDRQSISQFNRIASGTGEIAASAKYKGRVSAPKRFNMVINQNHRNRMRLDVEGVKQRLVFIPAEGHITVDLYKRFKDGVEHEYPAILAKLIRECALFHAGHRLPVPLAAQMALDHAYADGDEFQQWLLSSYEIPQGEVSKTDEDKMPTIDVVRIAFRDYAKGFQGVHVLTRGEVRERMAEMGIKIKDYGGSLGKKQNIIVLHPIPLAQAMRQY